MEAVDTSRHKTTIIMGSMHRLQHVSKSGLRPQSHKKEALIKTLDLPNKKIKHIFVLAEGDQACPPSLCSPLNGKEGKEQILGQGDLEVLTDQFERLHERIRVWVQLQNTQFRPLEHTYLEGRKRECESHILENELIHGDPISSISLADAVWRTRKIHLPIISHPNGIARDFRRPFDANDDIASKGSFPTQEMSCIVTSFLLGFPAMTNLKEEKKKGNFDDQIHPSFTYQSATAKKGPNPHKRWETITYGGSTPFTVATNHNPNGI